MNNIMRPEGSNGDETQQPTQRDGGTPDDPRQTTADRILDALPDYYQEQDSKQAAQGAARKANYQQALAEHQQRLANIRQQLQQLEDEEPENPTNIAEATLTDELRNTLAQQTGVDALDLTPDQKPALANADTLNEYLIAAEAIHTESNPQLAAIFKGDEAHKQAMADLEAQQEDETRRAEEDAQRQLQQLQDELELRKKQINRLKQQGYKEALTSIADELDKRQNEPTPTTPEDDDLPSLDTQNELQNEIDRLQALIEQQEQKVEQAEQARKKLEESDKAQPVDAVDALEAQRQKLEAQAAERDRQLQEQQARLEQQRIERERKFEEQRREQQQKLEEQRQQLEKGRQQALDNLKKNN